MISHDPGIPPGTRVLCVDDESSIGELVARILRRQLHCEVTTSATGSEALAVIARQSFDVVIVDYLMPEMDGGHLFREIEARAPALVPKLFFITGDTVSESTLATIRATGRPVLAKPFGLPELKRAITDLLRANDPEAPRAPRPPPALPNP